MEWYEKFEKVIELLDKDKVLQEVTNYFPATEIEEFVDSLIAAYDLENEFEEANQ